MPDSTSKLFANKTGCAQVHFHISCCCCDFVKSIHLNRHCFWIIILLVFKFLYLQAFAYDSPKKEKRHPRKWRSKHYSKDNKTTLQVLCLLISRHVWLKENFTVYFDIFVCLKILVLICWFVSYFCCSCEKLAVGRSDNTL